MRRDFFVAYIFVCFIIIVIYVVCGGFGVFLAVVRIFDVFFCSLRAFGFLIVSLSINLLNLLSVLSAFLGSLFFCFFLSAL